jgi:serine protease inhibitor
MPMMSQHGVFEYSENDDYQAVQLPYESRKMQMIIFLPRKHLSPQQFLTELSNQSSISNHLDILNRLRHEGTVVLPKFKIDYQIVLNQALRKLGIKQAFEEAAADFSHMATEPLYISEVRQKTFVEVDEKGTEAASTTTVPLTNGIEKPPKPFEMIVNRPFLFMISAWGPYTQMILFMGIVNDPAGAPMAK